MPVRIGLLSYSSSIHPGFSNEIVNGFYAAMPDSLIQEQFFQIVPEYVRQAGVKNTVESAQKLIFFDNVDIVGGMINYKAIPDLVPMIERNKKMGFFMDMGELIPYTQHISDRLFFNSFQYWQSEYALGYWAHKTFGDKGSVVMPLFDSGFHMQSSFRQGAIAAGSRVMDFTVLKDDPHKLDITQRTQQYLERAEKEAPLSYMHGIFRGRDALEFMAVYRQSSLYGKVPLIITAHMASEDVLTQFDLDMQCYTASMYNFKSPDAANQHFRQAYEFRTGQKPSVFALMGYEMGLSLLAMVPSLRKRDFESVIKALKTQTIKSPRGERSFYLDSDYSVPIIDIEKVTLANKNVTKIVIEQGRAMKYNDFIYEEIHRENVTGWQNPYMCT